MKGMIEYEIWCTFEIRHEFYTDDRVPLVLLPDQQTRLLLAKYNIILRQQMKNQWVMLKPKDESLFSNKEDLVLRFELQVTSEAFYYSTREYEPKANDIFRVGDTSKPGIWRTLEMPFRENTDEEHKHIVLALQSKQMYFEFLFIPKYTAAKDIRLREEKGLLQFGEPKEQILFDETMVYQFVSTEPVSLRKNYKYKVQLWEVRNSGERLLSGCIPCPDPGNQSVLRPQDTITTYFYF